MTRQFMINFRVKRNLTIDVMAKKCNCSKHLLAQIELFDDFVTHPNIAQRIAAVCKLTPEQATGILPPNYRPGPDYDPRKYVEEDRVFSVFGIRKSDNPSIYSPSDFQAG